MNGNPQNTSLSAVGQSAGHQPQVGKKGSSERTSSQITPELVSQLADRVLAMLRLEMKVEKERYQRHMHSPRSTQGGR